MTTMAFRMYESCKQFKNGNIHLRVRKEDLSEFNRDRVLFLSDLLFWLDCEFIGETFNLSNFATGHIIYNGYMDCWYIFNWDELEILGEGKTVILYARKMDDEIRGMIQNENS